MEVNGNNMSAQAQKDLLDKLNIRSASDVVNESKDRLGQEEFLTLMTAQTGITDMVSSMKSMAEEFRQFRVASVSNILGHSVLKTVADLNGELHGVFELEKMAIDTRVNFLDASTGEQLETRNMGPQASGLIGFQWTDLPSEYRDGSKQIRVEVMVNYGQGMESLQPNLFSKVIGAELDKTTGATNLELENAQTVDASSVIRFRM